MDQPTFFDDAADLPVSDWQEVPQARFLSWSDEMQRAYCAARDDDSAAHADDPWLEEFYLRRAIAYSTKETK